LRATARRQQLVVWARYREPDVIAEHGEAAPLTVQAPLAASPAGQLWHGTSVGSGGASGAAHLALQPGDGLGMAVGSVLVAPFTDPAWTPLFLKAGALVMETGGYLSHGAIVAREFGIPAVANLPGILAQLRDGERLVVDGDRGTVRRETA
jgi:pyruvate,water dikinase